MAAVKTAISLQEDLYEATEATAREMNISRSRLVALALKDYLRKRENQKLLDSINQAYDDELENEEQAWLGYGKRQMKRIAEDE